ncbi:MAG: ornithine carbamoyltransferase [Gemmataceae bacterium]|nr:ornithine carbamoyltransferase [Gemmataceae bacterium]
MKNCLSLLEYDSKEVEQILETALRIKKSWSQGKRPPLLAGKVLALVFEKPSLRTRASFEAAMFQMGGSSIFLSASDGAIGKRESVADFARTLSHFADAVVLRTFSHQTIVEFAEHATVPVINGLSELYHPCQALADILTIRENFGPKKGLQVVFVGDGNNVSRSLAIACAKAGHCFRLVGPKGYLFDKPFLDFFKKEFPDSSLEQTSDLKNSMTGADAIYADVWTSMGQEKERAKRLKIFKPYQVNNTLMAKASSNCIFLHCLPAHRGEEVTEEVIDGPQSRVFPQAGNRMHVQKALLLKMIGPRK